MSSGGASRPFKNRAAAGEELARWLLGRSWSAPVVVLGLARGGVAVAQRVAARLHAPLDVLVVRKIGVPWQPELAMGAIAPGGVVVRDDTMFGLSGDLAGADAEFDRAVQVERTELERREHVYRSGLPALELKGMTALLVDDGLATGSTMLAAIQAARRAGATKVIAAVPVASREAVQRIQGAADEVVTVRIPPLMSSIGQAYEQFEQLDDATVCRLLERAEGGTVSAEPRPLGS